MRVEFKMIIDMDSDDMTTNTVATLEQAFRIATVKATTLLTNKASCFERPDLAMPIRDINGNTFVELTIKHMPEKHDIAPTPEQYAAFETIADDYDIDLPDLHARVTPMFGGNGALVVQPCPKAIYLAVETDGHVHS